MKKITILSTITSSILLAGAYKIPEQSINSMGLGAAYVANTDGADTAYYNPANMAFMPEGNYVEAGITWAHLPRTKFSGKQEMPGVSYPSENKSQIENLQMPFMHYVANPYNDKLRWGFSMTVPGGLTKRWSSGIQKAYAEEFTLKNVELNPVASYKVSEKFAIGGGLRLLYSEGIVKSDGGLLIPLKREMEGDTIEFGYNLAMSYRPTSDIKVAATYRSNINIKEEGDANLYLYGVGKQYGANVTVPLPAAFNLAISKTWQEKYTLELNYERTYWSKYKSLDFEYDTPIRPALVPSFDTPKPRNWKDTNTFRVGFTAKVTDKLTLMTGYARDFTPVSKKYLSYELPDSNANIFTLGARYQIKENLSCGIAYLHDKKESFTIAPGDNKSGISGNFSGGGADLVTVGLSYKF